MTMRTRGVLVALVVAGLALFVGVLPSTGGETTPTTSTSGGCLPPSLSVDVWTLAFPSSNGPESTLERDCEVLCKSHLRRCRRIARISRTCGWNTMGTFAQLLNDICNTYDDPAQRRSCRDETGDLKRDIRQCILADERTARDCCEANVPACIDDCLEHESGEVQQCFTGGACLFDLANSSF